MLVKSHENFSLNMLDDEKRIRTSYDYSLSVVGALLDTNGHDELYCKFPCQIERRYFTIINLTLAKLSPLC